MNGSDIMRLAALRRRLNWTAEQYQAEGEFDTIAGDGFFFLNDRFSGVEIYARPKNYFLVKFGHKADALSFLVKEGGAVELMAGTWRKFVPELRKEVLNA